MSKSDGLDSQPIAATTKTPDIGWARILRALSMVAVMAGGIGSFSLMLRAAQRTPALLLFFFTVWVLSPFVGLLLAGLISLKWPLLNRVMLYLVSFFVTLGSLALYDELIVIRPPGSGNAFLFVLVPPVSWMIIGIVLATATIISRRQSARRPGM